MGEMFSQGTTFAAAAAPRVAGILKGSKFSWSTEWWFCSFEKLASDNGSLAALGDFLSKMARS